MSRATLLEVAEKTSKMVIREPEDGWGKGVEPRYWQAECLPILLRHYSVPGACNALIRAIMGSGKSRLAAQFAACFVLAANETLVVSTPSRFLVRQLKKTFEERLEGDSFFGNKVVGAYYTDEKATEAKVIITCNKSLDEVAIVLKKLGKTVPMLMIDEAHGSESRTVKAAVDRLAPQRVFGMTATPFRANKDESLTIFKKLLCDYGPKEAIRDKVVVPWRIVPWEGGEADLDQACIEMTELAIGPGLYNARDIPDARLFCYKAKDQGILLEEIHSKVSDTDIKNRMTALKAGQLKAVTHVSMLQEGADFPWLYWLCARRPVTSRTRFVQEIGRVLRAWTDPETGTSKDEAVIYDPHDLFSSFKLSYEAVLGGEYLVDEPDSEEDDELSPERIIDKKLEQSVFDIMKELMNAKRNKQPVSKTALAAYLGEVVNGFDVAGLVDRKISSRNWRSQMMTAKQAQTIEKMLWTLQQKAVPDKHQRVLQLLAKHGPSMNKGIASDLITIQLSLAEKRQWPTLKNLERAADDGLRKHEEQQGLRPKLITHGTQQAPPKPMTRPENRTPAEIRKAAKEFEKNQPSLFDGDGQ